MAQVAEAGPGAGAPQHRGAAVSGIVLPGHIHVEGTFQPRWRSSRSVFPASACGYLAIRWGHVASQNRCAAWCQQR